MPERVERLNELLNLYTQTMRNGNMLRNKAAEMRGLADQAADDYTRMRDEYRDRHGWDGWSNTVNDTKYSGLNVAQAAIKDNQWYMQRAQTYSSEAAMYYAQATAIMGNIQYERSLLNLPLIRD